MTDRTKELEELVSKVLGKLYLDDLASDREALEYAALQAVCACDYYDLADTIQQTPDEDLMAIVTNAVPCAICGE